MKRKILICLFCLALTANMVACGKSEATVTAAGAVEEQEPEKEAEPEAEEPETPAEPKTEEPIKETEPKEEEPEIPAETTEGTETETEAPAEEQAVDVGYTVTDCEPTTKYANTNCNIRSIPDKSGELVGTASTNTEIRVTGTTDTGWSRIEFNGVVCFIKSSLLSGSKIAVDVPSTPQAQPSTPQGGASPSADSGSSGGGVTDADIAAAAGISSSVSIGDLPVTGTTGFHTDGSYGTVQ